MVKYKRERESVEMERRSLATDINEAQRERDSVELKEA